MTAYTVHLTRSDATTITVEASDPHAAVDLAVKQAPGFRAEYVETPDGELDVYSRCEACNKPILEGDDYEMQEDADLCLTCAAEDAADAEAATKEPKLEHLVHGGIQPGDHLHRGTSDGTCSRCREPIAEHEVPILLWPMSRTSVTVGDSLAGDAMYQYCTRCAMDPDSDRCRVCGCTQNHACEEPCSWVEPGLCSSCAPAPRAA